MIAGMMRSVTVYRRSEFETAFARGMQASCAVRMCRTPSPSPGSLIGGKAVQHFCPECNRNYDCQVELTKEYSTLKPHGLRCLTPFEWHCPECARKDVLLHGK